MRNSFAIILLAFLFLWLMGFISGNLMHDIFFHSIEQSIEKERE